MKKIKRCRYCGKPIDPKRRADTHFCDPSEKAAFHKLDPDERLRRIKLYDSESSVLIYRPEANKPKADNLPPIPQEDNEKPPPLDNVIFLNGPEEKSDLAGIANQNDFNWEEDGQLPDQFIITTITEDNPLYVSINSKLKSCTDNIYKKKFEIAQLENSIKFEKQRNGGAYIYATAAIGAIAANEISKTVQQVPKYTKKKKYYRDSIKRADAIPTEKKTGNIWAMLGGGVLGCFVGSIMKEETKESREADKQKNIQNYRRQISQLNLEISELKKTETELTLKLSDIPKSFTKEIKEINPAYENAIKNRTTKRDPENNLSGNTSDPTKTSFSGSNITSAKNIAGLNPPHLNLDGIWKYFLGTPEINFFAIFYGMSGSGKSHLAMQAAVYLAKRFGRVLYISAEEAFSSTFGMKLRTMGAGDVERLDVSDIRTGEDILKLISNSYNFLIIDSLNTMGITPAIMKLIRAKFKDTAIIGVAQSTKTNLIRGSYEIVHDSDLTAIVSKGVAITDKNRFQEIGREFNIFDVYKKNNSK